MPEQCSSGSIRFFSVSLVFDSICAPIVPCYLAVLYSNAWPIHHYTIPISGQWSGTTSRSRMESTMLMQRPSQKRSLDEK